MLVPPPIVLGDVKIKFDVLHIVAEGGCVNIGQNAQLGVWPHDCDSKPAEGRDFCKSRDDAEIFMTVVFSWLNRVGQATKRTRYKRKTF